MTNTTLKRVSYILLCLATFLLIIDVVDICMVFGRKETGLFDFMPNSFREGMFIAYPVSLLLPFILFVFTRKVALKFDLIAKILFLLHGLAIVLLLEMLK